MGLLGATAALTLAGCGSRGESYRQRITVEVETPQGLKTGSSVSEVKWSYRDAFGEQGGSRASARGEAVAVELPGGQTLFALLTSETDPDWLATAAAHAVGDQVPPKRRGEGGYLEDHYLSGDIRPEYYPMLVRFEDLDEPTTVQMVDPSNLGAVFGPGVKLKRIWLRTTDEKVNSGIYGKLPWLGTTVRGYLDGQRTGGGPALSNLLDTTAFVRTFR